MFRRPLLAGIPLLTLFVLAPAVAQQGDKPLRERSALALEEIVVTANRREQSLQEVPMSVSAFTGDFFKDAGVRDLAGLEQYTPSLKITTGTDSRSTSIRIRGIGSVGTNVGIDPSVGMFIDGVYQGRAGMSVADLIDIERVEVLRGPQGTLYGKNTAAGAISIITQKPSAELESELEATYTTDERLELRGMVNVPLGDGPHATRLTGFLINGDHLYENEADGRGLNDADKWGFKSRTLFDFSESLGELLLTVDYSNEDTDCCAVGVIDYNGFSTLNAPGTNRDTQALADQLGNNAQGEPILVYESFEDSSGFSPPEADPFDDNEWVDADIFNKISVGGVALEWNRDVMDDHVITFINAWRHYEAESAYDGDFSAYNAVIGYQDIELDQYSSELRLTSPGGETWDYQAGLYYYHSELDSVGTFEQSQELVQNMNIDIFFPDGTLNIDSNNYKTTSFAAFGQIVWNVTEEFSATLGLRFTSETKERVGSQVTLPESALDIPPVAGPDIFYDEERQDDDFSPSFNLRYFVTPEIMTYASVSRGFKSGGYNQRRELEGTSAEFDEEIATSYELGWKGSTEDRRVQLNGTFYFVEYDDFQSQTFNGTTLEVTNAGSMESYGAEIELVWVPAVDLTISSALGYNKTEYKEFDLGQCTIDETVLNYFVRDGAQNGNPTFGGGCIKDLAGEEIDNAPEWTVSSFAQYDMALGDNIVGVARFEYNYVDEYFLDQDLDPKLKNDAVHLVNLRYTLTDPENTWEAAIWGRNVLDEEYYVFGIDIPVLGGYAGVAGPGAVYGITLRYIH